MRKYPKFIPGLELNRKFYHEVIKKIMDTEMPGIKYSAGMVGHGSDTIGLDSPTSMDHNWGPRMRIFLPEKNFHENQAKLDKIMRFKLPYEFMGFPTNYSKPSNDYIVQKMEYIKAGAVNHAIRFFTIESYFQHYLAYSPKKNPTVKEWLSFPEQALVELTSGEFYYDGLGVEKYRKKFAYYPEEVWKYIYMIQWDKIANEQSYMGRSGEVGDELGSHLIACRIVNSLMKLGFLIEKKYAPYSKWYGSAFAKLDIAKELQPVLLKVLAQKKWQGREKYLAEALEIIAKKHNQLGLTKPIETQVSDFNGRGYKVIRADEIYWAIHATFKNRFLKNMKYKLGSIDQFVDHARINHMNYVHKEFVKILK